MTTYAGTSPYSGGYSRTSTTVRGVRTPVGPPTTGTRPQTSGYTRGGPTAQDNPGSGRPYGRPSSAYNLPAARLVDFLAGRSPGDLPDERSCARATPADLRAVLPGFACETLVAAIPKMLRKLRGVRAEEALLYVAETRSSSPVRVLRGDDGQSVGVSGLYPCGEGAGYAGGIVSSAVDGLRAAEALLHAWAF